MTIKQVKKLQDNLEDRRIKLDESVNWDDDKQDRLDLLDSLLNTIEAYLDYKEVLTGENNDY